jgi:hypothetical protein
MGSADNDTEAFAAISYKIPKDFRMVRRKIAILLFLPALGLAQYQRPGSSTAQFLDIGVSARAEAMAGAYISVSEGAESCYYNPAALSRIKQTSAQFSYTKWFAGIQHEFLSVAGKLGRAQTLALSVTALHTDEMIVRTPLQPDGTGETFYAGNYRAGLSFSREMTNHVSVGMTANYIRIYLYQDFAQNAFAGDIAVLYDVGVRNLRFGFGIYNFGSSITFVHESYPLPTSFAFGLSMDAVELPGQKLLVSIAARKPNDGAPTGALGSEYSFMDLFFLRGGYYIDDRVKSFGLGTGVRLKWGSHGLQMDYSYSDFRTLGGSQRFGLNILF